MAVTFVGRRLTVVQRMDMAAGPKFDRMIANPLWDIDENTSAFDFTHFMQEIQNAISTDLPDSFVARSFCFSIFISPGSASRS